MTRTTLQGMVQKMPLAVVECVCPHTYYPFGMTEVTFCKFDNITSAAFDRIIKYERNSLIHFENLGNKLDASRHGFRKHFKNAIK